MQLWLSFLYGGLLVSGINYVSNTLVNPALATIIAAAPIGILSVSFIQPGLLTDCYVRNYMATAAIHVIAALLLYTLLRHAQMSKNVAVAVALVSWFVLQGIKYGLLNAYAPWFLHPKSDSD